MPSDLFGLYSHKAIQMVLRVLAFEQHAYAATMTKHHTCVQQHSAWPAGFANIGQGESKCQTGLTKHGPCHQELGVPGYAGLAQQPKHLVSP